MDDKKFTMTLLEFYDLFKNKLISRVDKNELDEFFFWLIDHYCNYSRMDYILNSSFKISKTQEQNLINSIDSLLNEMPIQYVVGETKFMNLVFKLNNSVLIPRPETEELVRWIINDAHTNKNILDIGTGSGCIAVSLSKYLNNCKVTGWDISEDIIKIASHNAYLNDVNVELELSDITKPKFLDYKYDVIVSNPPYITKNEKQFISKNVKFFEPHIALFVENEDPLCFYKKIFDFSNSNLKSNGFLYIEINENFSKEVIKLLKDKGFYDIKLKKDFRLKNRMIKAIKK
ncbi:MAG: peptide chain release factor N(5)-glutamine methyltransferase [Flavobacteriaceae bacterium]|nr:peptide chain release factor N(5)-glutamine methyltransferase [Flavobacteriaceae bacterium]MDG1344193.1 peptide chain release factor N(5)-glutamine methyltransferase [Flavobacteriaceae bacterium]MDG2485554.1 peptide chain release factor N(5)-glutamine methyltransferase [Flavobacteriaceae bacterium]|tara:strand:- start:1112 stop:1975 length:864 start_codon:yes stop_codon:yes gene_type:complete